MNSLQYILDDNNRILVVPEALNSEERRIYEEASEGIVRVRGKSAFNQLKPRYEVCYTVDGSPMKYSGRTHYTTEYPQHVVDLIPTFLEMLSEVAGEDLSEYTLSTGIDIVYDSSLPGSGSIGAHSDDECHREGRHWDLILIYSIGQTRTMRFRRKEPRGPFIDVPIEDNSLVAMFGPTFQYEYTHQIDRLKKREELGRRHSLNIRFFPSN